MKGFLAGLILGAALSAPTAIAYEPRPCILAVLADHGAALLRKAIPSVRAGDMLISSECWRDT